ncbi:MAG TPA: sensor histidine kinase [Acidimicrobiales bacterium]|nr:sensor histidine kinase [Acidimicrobiales bacterium]
MARLRDLAARLRATDPTVVDGLLAAVLVVVEVGGAALIGRYTDEPALTPFGVVLLLAGTVPVTWRRRAPVVVWAVVGAATGAYGIAELPDPVFVGAFVSLYTVVARCPARTSVPIGVATAALWLLATAMSGDSDLNDYYPAVVLAGLAGALGVLARTLQRQREEDAARAVAEERARLARELHDVVAHAVSMVVVQAEAGAAAGGPPERVEEAFDAIADTGRTALGELRRLLGVLRSPEEPALREPQPGVAQLEPLVESVRRAGLPVEVRVEGADRPLPPGVDLSAYRIVQEALTNSVKHAGPARASVVLRYGEHALELEVVDDGRGPRAPSAGGHGLVGMRERTALLGGELDVGPAPGGGFAVRARLPLEPSR